MTTQITLPRDAEGREIPLDTKVLYGKNGMSYEVWRFDFRPRCGKDGIWTAVFENNIERLTSRMYLTPQDNWEKLLDDLDNTAEKASSSIFIATPCAWFNDGNRHCDDCPANESPGVSCNVQLVKNIAARIRKLRGEDE